MYSRVRVHRWLPNAPRACNLLAAVPAGTGAIGAAVEAIKMVVCGALAGGEGSEAVVAVKRCQGVDRQMLVCATVHDPVGLCA